MSSFVSEMREGFLHQFQFHSYSLVLSVTALFVLSLLASRNYLRRTGSQIPFYTDEKNYGSRPFQVATADGNAIILPPNMLDEIKMMPDKDLPSWLAIYLQRKHTGLCGTTKQSVVTNIVQLKLNKHLATIFPEIVEEIRHAISVEIADPQNWTPSGVYPGVSRIVCRVTGKAFVGEKLNRDEEWIKMNLEYTRNVFIAAYVLRMFPSPLRYIVRYWRPEMKIVRAHHAKAEKILTPIIAARNAAEKTGKYIPPKDTIEWAREILSDAEKKDYGAQTLLQLFLGSAAIHTTSQTTYAVLYNLASFPEYIPILREEAERVLKEYNGAYTLESMGQLKKLDSFMKETQRLDPLGFMSVQRQALRSFTLSDGTYIPSGSIILSATEAIATDPNFITDPSKFDGMRFYEMSKEKPELEKRNMFYNTSKTHLHFGTARHACPGRWFASHEIKLIVVEILGKYDISLKEKEGVERKVGVATPGGEFLVRRRRVV